MGVSIEDAVVLCFFPHLAENSLKTKQINLCSVTA